MALPEVGSPLSFSQINTELGRSSNATLSLTDNGAMSLGNIKEDSFGTHTPVGPVALSSFQSKSNTWLVSFATSATDYGSSIAIDDYNHLYLSAHTSSGPEVTKLYIGDGNREWTNSLTGVDGTFGKNSASTDGYCVTKAFTSTFTGTFHTYFTTTSPSGTGGLAHGFASSELQASAQSGQTQNNLYLSFTGKNGGRNIVGRFKNSNGSISFFKESDFLSGSVVPSTPAVDSSGYTYFSAFRYDDSSSCIFKFDTAGNVAASKLLDSPSGNWSPAFGYQTVAVDSSSNSYFLFSGSNGGVVSHVLVKLDSNFNVSWVREVSGNAVFSSAVTTDSSGNVYWGCTLQTVGSHVFKFNSAGTLQWQRQLTGNINIRSLRVQNNTLNINFDKPSNYFNILRIPTSGATGSWTTIAGTYGLVVSSLSIGTSLSAGSIGSLTPAVSWYNCTLSTDMNRAITQTDTEITWSQQTVDV